MRAWRRFRGFPKGLQITAWIAAAVIVAAIIGAATGSKAKNVTSAATPTASTIPAVIAVAKFAVTPTAVLQNGDSKVGVAFQVKNIGTGPGTPNCVVIAAVAASSGGQNNLTLAKINPGQFDYQDAYGDVVTISDIGAQLITLDNGDVSVTCKP